MIRKLLPLTLVLLLTVPLFGQEPNHVQIMAVSNNQADSNGGGLFTIKNRPAGLVWWPIDSLVNNDRETCWTYSIPTARIGTFHSIASITAQDSAYGRDSAYFRLYTSDDRSNASKTKLIYSESCAVAAALTAYYDYFSVDNDTMFWAETYWVVILADSTGGEGSAAKARAATLANPRKYSIKFDYITKP